MNELVLAKDLTPFPDDVTGAIEGWLRRLHGVDISELVIPLAGPRDVAQREPLVWCDPNGVWWAGRHIGSVLFEGRELRILPRFGFEVLDDWLAEVLNLVVTPAPGHARATEVFLERVLATIWGAAFVQAARHGVPALKRVQQHAGPTVRGRLDSRGTQRRFSLGRPELVSEERARTLDNPIGRTIVLAHDALRRALARSGVPQQRWLPERGRHLLPSLRAACGPRPALPSRRALERIRYTPITQSYRPFVALSHRIARHEGWLGSDTGGRETYGVLLDAAELWELFVVKTLQGAASATGFRVLHGTRSEMRWEVAENRAGLPLSRVIPDAVLSEGESYRLVIDAKYKRLTPNRERPHGFEQGDLYQMIAYMERFDAGRNLSVPRRSRTRPWAGCRSRAMVHEEWTAAGLC